MEGSSSNGRPLKRPQTFDPSSYENPFQNSSSNGSSNTVPPRKVQVNYEITQHFFMFSQSLRCVLVRLTTNSSFCLKTYIPYRLTSNINMYWCLYRACFDSWFESNQNFVKLVISQNRSVVSDWTSLVKRSTFSRTGPVQAAAAALPLKQIPSKSTRRSSSNISPPTPVSIRG